eukprot:4335868-Pyramimonas_sp.AAC.1
MPNDDFMRTNRVNGLKPFAPGGLRCALRSGDASGAGLQSHGQRGSEHGAYGLEQLSNPGSGVSLASRKKQGPCYWVVSKASVHNAISFRSTNLSVSSDE